MGYILDSRESLGIINWILIFGAARIVLLYRFAPVEGSNIVLYLLITSLLAWPFNRAQRTLDTYQNTASLDKWATYGRLTWLLGTYNFVIIAVIRMVLAFNIIEFLFLIYQHALFGQFVGFLFFMAFIASLMYAAFVDVHQLRHVLPS